VPSSLDGPCAAKARYEEQIELLRRLWTEPVLDYRGRFHRIDRAGLLPRPSRSIPIWIGGAHDRVLRRGARLADGFIFSQGGVRSLEAARTARDYVAAEGRDPAAFGVEAIVHLSEDRGKWIGGLEAGVTPAPPTTA